MLSTDGFKKFATNVVLFLHVTSKTPGEPHPNLLREKGGNGYPTFSFLDSTGRVLRQVPRSQLDVAGLQSNFAELRRWRALDVKGKAGDKTAARDAFLLAMQFEMLTQKEAKSGLIRFHKDLTKKQQTTLRQRLVNMEFQDLLRQIDVADQRTLVRSGKGFAAMIQGNRIPRSQQIITFWQGALAYAESEKDVALFAKIFAKAKKLMAGDPRAQRYMGQVEARLKKLRAAK